MRRFFSKRKWVSLRHYFIKSYRQLILYGIYNYQGRNLEFERQGKFTQNLRQSAQEGFSRNDSKPYKFKKSS